MQWRKPCNCTGEATDKESLLMLRKPLTQLTSFSEHPPSSPASTDQHCKYRWPGRGWRTRSNASSRRQQRPWHVIEHFRAARRAAGCATLSAGYQCKLNQCLLKPSNYAMQLRCFCSVKRWHWKSRLMSFNNNITMLKSNFECLCRLTLDRYAKFQTHSPLQLNDCFGSPSYF